MSPWALERRGAVAVVQFAAPPRNLMTFAAMTELGELTEQVATWEDVTYLVIASAVPGFFVAHGDLEDLGRLGRGEAVQGDTGSWPRTLSLFGSMPQVVVAAVNGQAWGGGLELTLACTLRVAGPAAHFALPEVALGLIPGGGGTQRLPRLIGPGRAAEMVLSSRVVDAEEARQIGLVQHLVTDDDFLGGVLRWVEPLAARPAAAVRAAKASMVGGADLPLQQGLQHESSLVRPLLASEESLALQADMLRRCAAAPSGQVVQA